ncbi:MAG TPA: MBL fold metallo-hydrolase [Flavobacterium sp.]|nr:MBL fold metallo-hydrolase [Flavobacterium sp.]
MSNFLTSKFTFYRAGQGSFYAGRIYDRNRSSCYTVVYDCGTSQFIAGHTKSLNNEIDDFRENTLPCYPDGVIDLLFISHLDFDHVSGIRKLLNEFVVKKIVIPYFPESIRKYSLLSYSEEVAEAEFSFEEYASFIDNPYRYLSGDGRREIYIVLDEETGEYNPNENPGDEVGIFPAGTISGTLVNELFNLSGVYTYKNNLQFFINTKWEFTTYFKSVSDIQYQKLQKSINAIIGQPESHILDLTEIRNIIISNRKKAHECYVKCLPDINCFGLVLLHGPTNYKYLEGKLSFFNLLNRYSINPYESMFRNGGNRSSPNDKFLGTLLMGDTSLKPENNPVDFPAQFREKVKSLHIFQVPHHGSEKNWDYQVYEELLMTQYYPYPYIVNVCNFGYGNKFGHPGHRILESIGSNLILNSQFLRFSYKYKIHY